MVNILALCIATEDESSRCTDLYISFKGNLQGMASRNNAIIVHDIKSVNKQQQRRGNTNKLSDKLEKKMNECHVVFVVFSHALKVYLDDGTPTGLLKQDEREVLLRGLEKYKEKKVVCVCLDDSLSQYVPRMFQGVAVNHGSKDLSNLLEVTIPAKYSLNM